MLQTAPKWQRRGIEAYEMITRYGDVFFLDTIERTSKGSDAADVVATEKFKSFQLRARQGELKSSDWDYIAGSMDRAKRTDEFCGPEVYKLVTRRRDRDRLNLETLKSEIASGKAAMRIPASNSSTVATAAHDDEMGLPSTLFLSVGARVMITHNLCVELGLCNGTVGIVHDIMCDSNGTPVAVLLRVRRRTSTRDGYAGPSFLDSDGVDTTQEAIVAVSQWKAEIWDSGQLSTRSQFPLMVSVHPPLRHAATLTRCLALICHRALIRYASLRSWPGPLRFIRHRCVCLAPHRMHATEPLTTSSGSYP